MILRVVKWIANIRFGQTGLPAADFAFIIPQSDSCDKSQKESNSVPGEVAGAESSGASGLRMSALSH